MTYGYLLSTHSFSQSDKLAGAEDNDNMFHFTCFDLGDPHHGIVGLIGGPLSIFHNLEKKCLTVSLVSLRTESLVSTSVYTLSYPL